MLAAANAVRREIRLAFQAKYGRFWKCALCGAYLGPLTMLPPLCCDRIGRAHGYTPLPDAVTIEERRDEG